MSGDLPRQLPISRVYNASGVVRVERVPYMPRMGDGRGGSVSG